MAGKAILLLVMSCFILFSKFGIQNANITNQAFDKMVAYSDQSAAYNIAVAGANVAFARLNQLRLTTPYPRTISLGSVSLNGGTFSVSCVNVTGTQNYRLTSTGTFNGRSASVVVTYQPGNWGNYAYFSESEGTSTIWWMARDSVFGPFHTQSKMNVSNRPYFGDNVSAKDTSLNYQTNRSTDYPTFRKSFYQEDYPMRADGLDSTKYGANHGGKKFTGQDFVAGTPAVTHQEWKRVNGKYKWVTVVDVPATPDQPAVHDLTLVFNGTNVTYTYGSASETVPITTLSPNGVIMMEDGNIHTQGTIDGVVTVLATGSGYGNVYLDNDVTLTGNPRANSNCDDYLGIVAENNVWITDNSNNDNNINIDAAIYCQNGGFGAQNYKTRGNDGTIKLYGGVVQRTRQFVSSFNGENIEDGFAKSYHYDTRFQGNWPPYYPCGPNFRVISWYDKVGSSSGY